MLFQIFKLAFCDLDFLVTPNVDGVPEQGCKENSPGEVRRFSCAGSQLLTKLV